MPEFEQNARSNTRVTLKLAACIVVGFLGVIYAYGMRTLIW